MKIDGPSGIKGQPTQSTRKGKTNGAFHTFLEAEIAATRKNDSATDQPPQQSGDQNASRLMEEAATLLDQALQNIEAGEKPAAEVLAGIQHLREQLHRQGGGNDAQTMLAVEAERIRALNS